MKILLISGHGAGDSGACAKIKGKTYKEAEETVVMVKKIKEQLSKYNVTVDLYPTDRNAYEDVKAGCLKVDFSKYDYVLEIHFNACVNDLKGNGKTTGTEAFITTSDKTNSAEKNMLSCLSALGLNNRGVKSHNWTVINRAKTKGADSCLLEVCFIDDADDMAIYTKNKDSVAKTIALGVVKTYSLKKKTTTNTNEITTKKNKTNTKAKTVAAAKSYSKGLYGNYKVNAKSLNMRSSPNSENDDNIITSLKNGEVVTCYGYYTRADGMNWFLVTHNGYVGYCCAKYLKKEVGGRMDGD